MMDLKTFTKEELINELVRITDEFAKAYMIGNIEDLEKYKQQIQAIQKEIMGRST